MPQFQLAMNENEPSDWREIMTECKMRQIHIFCTILFHFSTLFFGLRKEENFFVEWQSTWSLQFKAKQTVAFTNIEI